MYIVLVPVGIWFVLRYAKKVKADPGHSRVGKQEATPRSRPPGSASWSR